MLDIFTVIWGAEMADSFTGLTLTSLVQPGNAPACRGLLGTYTIYTNDETRRCIKRSRPYRELAGHVQVCWEPLRGSEWEVTSNILQQMHKSMLYGNFMLVMSPDWCLGDGSLLHMARMCAEGNYNPILYGFPRVTEKGYEELRARLRAGRPVSNRELVSLAMRHIEQTTYMVGVSMEHWILSNNTWIVGHNVPTPCLRPDKQIVELFATNETLNSGYDHALPYIMVERAYPWHMINHSDIYFQVERGRHIIGEHVLDLSRWQTHKALQGLRFFDNLRQVWQGI